MHKDAIDSWLALMIGNSRLHWAWFRQSTLVAAWDTPHFQPQTVAALIERQMDLRYLNSLCSQDLTKETDLADALETVVPPSLPLWLASVVPAETPLWQSYPLSRTITLAQVPLLGLYPTLGIDRALAAWGAATRLGLPVLVIDAGTALTFTGIDAEGCLVGGAIVPGLGLQLRALNQRTAALPLAEVQASQLPPRWALNTEDAIRSGVLYTLLAGLQEFITQWWQKFPGSPIALRGGDSLPLLQALHQQSPDLARQIKVDEHLIFWGMWAIVNPP